MNARALELGAKNTHFTNPSGLHEDDHYTTARDVALLARHAMGLDVFREIVGKTAYTMEPTNRHAVWDTLNTSNTFLYATSDYFSRVTGVKTGYTNNAGFTLAASAQNDQGLELLSVTMGAASRNASNKDAKTLLEYGFLNFEQVSAASKSALLTTAPIQKSKQPLDVLLSEDVTLLKRKDAPLALTYELRLDEALTAPVEAGQIVGSAAYFNDGYLVANVPVVAASGIKPESGILPLLKSLLNIVLGSLLLCAVLILFLRIRYRRRSRRRTRRTGARLTAMPYMSVNQRKKNRSGWI
jgi:D-alanyl-D-alanine carboxypeptidase